MLLAQVAEHVNRFREQLPCWTLVGQCCVKLGGRAGLVTAKNLPLLHQYQAGQGFGGCTVEIKAVI